MKRHVTKVQVAQAAGVSRSAASLVLNGRRHTLSESTVQSILSAAKRLGYSEAPLPHVRCVGFVAQKEDFFDPVDDAYQRITAAILSELEAKDYNAITCFVEGKKESPRRFPRVLREGGVDGFIVLATDAGPYDAIRSRVTALEAKTVFAEWVSQDTEGIGWVASDDRAGCRAAGEYVASLGHQRVAVLSAGRTEHPAAIERLEGHLSGLSAFGVKVRSEWLLEGEWLRDDGRRLMKRILDLGRPWPTAVLCANDWMALGAMDMARECGIAIPDEMSFVGVDNCTAAVAESSPALTTVGLDLEQVGRTAARKLIDWIEARQVEPPACWVPTSLVERRSVVPPPDSRT